MANHLPTIKFKAERPIVHYMKSNQHYRIEMDVPETLSMYIREIVGLPEGMYKITIEPDVSEG